jgi:hypothetical protein
MNVVRQSVGNSRQNAAQQSMHLTLGILRTSQAVFHALAFFQLDGFAVPAPAQVSPKGDDGANRSAASATSVIDYR